MVSCHLLFCGDHTIASEEGVHQGDPLGPLLFCLTIHPFITKLPFDICIFYLDVLVFDQMLRNILSKVLNINLSEERAWLQASLPVHLGGIWVRREVQLALSAYLASAAGCSNLVQLIIPTSTTSPPDLNIKCATHQWNQGHLNSHCHFQAQHINVCGMLLVLLPHTTTFSWMPQITRLNPTYWLSLAHNQGMA